MYVGKNPKQHTVVFQRMKDSASTSLGSGVADGQAKDEPDLGMDALKNPVVLTL